MPLDPLVISRVASRYLLASTRSDTARVMADLLDQVERLRGKDMFRAVFTEDFEHPSLDFFGPGNKRDLLGGLMGELTRMTFALAEDKESEISGKAGTSFKSQWPRLKPVEISEGVAQFMFDSPNRDLLQVATTVTALKARKYGVRL